LYDIQVSSNSVALPFSLLKRVSSGRAKGAVMYHTATTNQTGTFITIRAAGPEDAEAVSRVAQCDSRAVPKGELLIALVDGEVRAAISMGSGETIADPFHRTKGLVSMLTLRATELRGATRVPALASLPYLAQRASA
jgi:hypothetical protein